MKEDKREETTLAVRRIQTPVACDLRRGSDQYKTTKRPSDSDGSSSSPSPSSSSSSSSSFSSIRCYARGTGQNLRVAARCHWIGSLDRGSARCGERRTALTSRRLISSVYMSVRDSTSPGEPASSTQSYHFLTVTFYRSSFANLHPPLRIRDLRRSDDVSERLSFRQLN